MSCYFSCNPRVFFFSLPHTFPEVVCDPKKKIAGDIVLSSIIFIMSRLFDSYYMAVLNYYVWIYMDRTNYSGTGMRCSFVFIVPSYCFVCKSSVIYSENDNQFHFVFSLCSQLNPANKQARLKRCGSFVIIEDQEVNLI